MISILITGSHGFIGKNLVTRLKAMNEFSILEFNRGNSDELLIDHLKKADHIIHLAGENRPHDVSDFIKVNVGLTKKICDLLIQLNKSIHWIFASSTHALAKNDYGQSKLAAENLIKAFIEKTNSQATIYRLPGVFGKWSKPNYNSVVATFCHNLALDLPIQINDPSFNLTLVYIDDVVSDFIFSLKEAKLDRLQYKEVSPNYQISIQLLANTIESFKQKRQALSIDHVGTGLQHALYSTFISFLPKEQFSYFIPLHQDQRGKFGEILKTIDSGQFSFLSAPPGVIRGGHYHDTKIEKFLILKGLARFCFRNIMTAEEYEIIVSADKPQIVETIPGWAHNITNIGTDEMILVLWANEIFNPALPDTFEHNL